MNRTAAVPLPFHSVRVAFDEALANYALKAGLLSVAVSTTLHLSPNMPRDVRKRLQTALTEFEAAS